MGVGETGLAVSAHVDISYRVTRHLDEDAMAVALEWLSAEERARCARLAFASDRRAFLASRPPLPPPPAPHRHRRPPPWLFHPDPNREPDPARAPEHRPPPPSHPV